MVTASLLVIHYKGNIYSQFTGFKYLSLWFIFSWHSQLVKYYAYHFHRYGGLPRKLKCTVQVGPLQTEFLFLMLVTQILACGQAENSIIHYEYSIHVYTCPFFIVYIIKTVIYWYLVYTTKNVSYWNHLLQNCDHIKTTVWSSYSSGINWVLSS